MRIEVIVHPNAKQPRVEQDLTGVLHVYVHEPPLEGKANRAVIDSLAEYLHVRKSSILLRSGVRTKQKLFDVMQ